MPEIKIWKGITDLVFFFFNLHFSCARWAFINIAIAVTTYNKQSIDEYVCFLSNVLYPYTKRSFHTISSLNVLYIDILPNVNIQYASLCQWLLSTVCYRSLKAYCVRCQWMWATRSTPTQTRQTPGKPPSWMVWNK